MLPSRTNFLLARKAFVQNTNESQDGKLTASPNVALPYMAKMWQRSVAYYTNCMLTNEEDRVVAIAGLAKEMHKFIGWKHIGGLWEPSLTFDIL